jgi:hypothetical protein
MTVALDVHLPAKNDPRLRTLVCNGSSKPIKLLALRFMLMRMTQEVKRDPSPGTIARNVDELHGFFSKNQHMAGDDIAVLFA